MELILKNVSASYGREKVLDEVNLAIGEGETVFVGGRNGSGKTTLLRVMSGLMDYEGSVTAAIGSSIMICLKTSVLVLAQVKST